MHAERYTELLDGRRKLSIGVGAISVVVTEVAARSMTEVERDDVRLARRSYDAMWGGGSDVLMNDLHDGFGDGLIHAWHYLAWVRDEAGPSRLVTMRKVVLLPEQMTAEQLVDPGDLLPVDIRFWSVGGRPLWQVLRMQLRMLAPADGLAEYRWAAIGRTGAYPYRDTDRTERARDCTAVAFAAIQLLAVHRDRSFVWLDTLCPEFPDRVLGLDVEGEHVAPEFTPTERMLGLPDGTVRMDNGSPLVREHKTRFPGYFIHNEDAGHVLGELLELGLVTVPDLAAAAFHLAQEDDTAAGDRSLLHELVDVLAHRDHRRFARLLTRPRFMKYLVPLLTGTEPLRRMSSAEFQNRIIDGTRDGPFSSTVTPEAWEASARRVLAAAARKYGTGSPVRRPADPMTRPSGAITCPR